MMAVESGWDKAHVLACTDRENVRGPVWQGGSRDADIFSLSRGLYGELGGASRHDTADNPSLRVMSTWLLIIIKQKTTLANYLN
nr:hypothetical protein BgiMline_016848 [Biomphalaria glabrata]